MSLILPLDESHLTAYKNNWRSFFLLGIALVILGFVAVGSAVFTTILSMMVLGFILSIGGILILFDTFTFWRGKHHGFFYHLIIGLLYLFVGLIIIQNPIQVSVPLTLILGIFYIIAGVLRVATFSIVQPPHWGWGWFNGIVTLILGILIINNWPSTGLYVIGLFVGIDLIFCGWAYVMSALAAKNYVVRR